MHVGMSVAAQSERPCQGDSNCACRVDAVDNQTEYVEQHRSFKLIRNVVREALIN